MSSDEELKRMMSEYVAAVKRSEELAAKKAILFRAAEKTALDRVLEKLDGLEKSLTARLDAVELDVRALKKIVVGSVPPERNDSDPPLSSLFDEEDDVRRTVTGKHYVRRDKHGQLRVMDATMIDTTVKKAVKTAILDAEKTDAANSWHGLTAKGSKILWACVGFLAIGLTGLVVWTLAQAASARSNHAPPPLTTLKP